LKEKGLKDKRLPAGIITNAAEPSNCRPSVLKIYLDANLPIRNHISWNKFVEENFDDIVASVSIKKGAYKTEGENKKSLVDMRLALQKYTTNLSNIWNNKKIFHKLLNNLIFTLLSVHLVPKRFKNYIKLKKSNSNTRKKSRIYVLSPILKGNQKSLHPKQESIFLKEQSFHLQFW
jgi:hypothetical protein